MRVGFILAKWNEVIGPEIVTVYPDNFIEDPNLIAIQCFSSSQFVFGGEQFIQLSLIMPFIYLHLEAVLFFDYILDDSVRGGRSPILLILLYDDTIPRSIIDQYHEGVLKKPYS